MPRYLLLAASILLLGCGDRSDAPTPEPPALGDSAPAPAATAAESSLGDSLPTTTGVRLALDGSGLMLVDAATGTTRALPFGTPAGPAVEAVTAVLGAPSARIVNEDCGMGPLEFVTFDGVLLALQDEHFLGWTARPAGTVVHRTMSNIGLGSTRADLEGAYAALIAPSTLGIEFIAGGLQGVLASDAANAQITAFWAGASCVAR